MNYDSHLHVYIGYDERQDEAWEVCAESLRQAASKPVSIRKLNHRLLRDLGFLKREWKTEGETGRYIDYKDGKPFSTQFAHSRFLVPELCKFLGTSAGDAAVFVDSDFVFIDDPYDMVYECLDMAEAKAVHVVKHKYHPENTVKMDGQVQVDYSKKLWSSLMLFDLSFPTRPTAAQVNNEDGRWLHNFEWLNGEHEIGELSERWNFIPGHSNERIPAIQIGAIHYTEGVPAIPGYEYTQYADVYNKFARDVYKKKLRDGR